MRRFLIVAVLFLGSKTNCDTKVWIFTSNITDPKNWESVAKPPDCNGLVFTEDNSAEITIEQLEVKSLLLPSFGTFKLESGSKIVFDGQSKSQMNCVKLKPIRQWSWHNFQGWNNTNDPDNPAVPYNERLPNRFDDVIVPQTNVRMTQSKVKSITIGKRKISRTLDLMGEFPLENFDTEITNDICRDYTGCESGITEFDSDESCEVSFPERDFPSPSCLDPIKPFGFCDVPQCGASIIIQNYRAGFRLSRIKKKLKEYESFAYANKIPDGSGRIQIFFTERHFTGQSIIEATEFYELLRQDKSYFCGNVELATSGPSDSERKLYVKNALSLTFGTLLAVIVIFGLLFLTYSSAWNNWNIRNRLLGNRPLSTYILHYASMEDRGYVVDGQSIAGSTVNLNRSFDNPMYEQASSSKSTSHETIVSVKLEGHQKVEEAAEDLEEAKELTETVEDNILLKDI